MAEKTKKPKRRRSRNGFVEAINGLLSLVLLVLLALAGVLIYGVAVFNAEGPIEQDRAFVVESGNVLSTVAQRLEEQGFIANADIFNYGSRFLGRGDGLKAGEFEIPANASMHDIIIELTEGTPVQHQVIVPEGFTSWQVVERVTGHENLTGSIDTLPLEGSLLPGAYAYQRGDTRQSVIDAMARAMDEALTEVWANRDPDLPLETPEDLVTLASIVEKETAVPDERPLVAGVFVNRLEIGMRLQSDPTIVYGITNGQSTLGRGLRRSEIDEATPYNTYRIDGLPPGPIANPGIESLRATANPAETDALYFVADGTGGHVFADNYADHQANVAAWRAIEAERAQELQELEDAGVSDEGAAQDQDAAADQ